MSISNVVLRGYGPGGSIYRIALGGYNMGAPPQSAPTLCTRGYGFSGRISSICHSGFSAYLNLPEPPIPGEQYQDMDVLYTGTGYSLQTGEVPPVTIGTVAVVDQVTRGTSYTIIVNPDGTLVILAEGDTSRQILQANFFRQNTNTYDGAFFVFINPVGPSTVAPIPLQMVPEGGFFNLNLATYVQNPEGDTLTFAVTGGALPTGANLSGTVISGFTPDIQTGTVNLLATDLAGLTFAFSVNYNIFDTATTVVPNIALQSPGAAMDEILALALTVGAPLTPASSSTIPAGFILSQSPAAGSLVEAGTPISWQLSTGPATGQVYAFSGVLDSQPATVGGEIAFNFTAQRIIPAPQVRSRSIQWIDAVRMAEGNDYKQILYYPVYQFGGGQVRRVFVQPT